MTDKSSAENSGVPKTPSSQRSPRAGGEVQPSSVGPSSAARSARAEGAGVRVLGRERKQYLVASRRTGGVTTFGVSPLALSAVEQALRQSPDIEVLDMIGPRSTVGAFADGLPGAPNVIVARMEENKAAMLQQQAQGQLIVETDQPLSLLDAPYMPPMVNASFAGATPLSVRVVVVGKEEAPVEGAEVYLYGSLLPAMGVTNNTGEVTLNLLGDTPQSIRALYVKPKSDYWSFYQSQPGIDPSQANIVGLRPLSDTYPNFPAQQVIGWGQKAMRLDQVPPDRRGQGIKIAIIDSGAATSHEDLRSISQGYDALGKRTNTNDWMTDTIAHGSHCAGIIAGSADNKVGVLGFAPAAEIHVCKIFPGGQISQLIDALEYCIERQIDIVNLSLGTDQLSEILEQQLVRATSLGIACIAAAGNSGGAVQYPASSPNVLAVAAIGRLGEFPPDSYHAQTVQPPGEDGFFSPRFTCFGAEIALCAPGVAVLSSVPPNNFAVWDGTSMAAPHVSGLAALVLAHHPDFSGPFRSRNAQRVQRLFQVLKASARPVNVGDPRRTGFGIPDAPTALGLQVGVQMAQPAFTPQGFFGGLAGQLGQPLGGMVGPIFGTPTLGPQIGAAAALGRYFPFAAAPVNAGLLQQFQAGPIPTPWGMPNAAFLTGRPPYWSWWSG